MWVFRPRSRLRQIFRNGSITFPGICLSVCLSVSLSLSLSLTHSDEHARFFSKPLTKIINGVRDGERWPGAWRKEEVSVIPKTKNPEDFDGCRNISCTSVFSKLCETYMLDWIYEEVPQEDSQFGGYKGSGTDHLLCELTTNIMEQVDDNLAAVGLISVDMAKAFNRMSHEACVEALARQGASTQTIALVANFLSGRSMRIKLGRGIFSTLRETPGGAPPRNQERKHPLLHNDSRYRKTDLDGAADCLHGE